MGLRDIELTLPPGFRFYPSDEELVCHYLHNKVADQRFAGGAGGTMVEVDLHVHEPWELPDVAKLSTNEWYFFSFRDRKYATGLRTNRATKSGYWKATGKDRKVSCDGGAVCGVRKTLVFYKGRAPGGERTDWVMHEYRLCQDLLHGASNFIGAYALCRVIKRTEAGLLHGEPALAKARGGNSGVGHRQMMMSKVPSSSSLVTTDHQLSNSGSPTRLELDVISNTFQVQNSSSPPLYGGGEVACDMIMPPVSTPPQDAAFFIGDGFPVAGAGEPHSHFPNFFGDMSPGGGMISEHELRWDTSPPCSANAFSIATTTAGADLWNPAVPNAGELLCRQASDGGDDVVAWLSSLNDNMVVY